MVGVPDLGVSGRLRDCGELPAKMEGAGLDICKFLTEPGLLKAERGRLFEGVWVLRPRLLLVGVVLSWSIEYVTFVAQLGIRETIGVLLSHSWMEICGCLDLSPEMSPSWLAGKKAFGVCALERFVGLRAALLEFMLPPELLRPWLKTSSSW